MKRALADSVASISGSNKISTPILNNNQQQQPAQQRYVPSRQINNVMQPRQQQQQLDDEFDENGNLMQPLPLSPRTQNQSYNQVSYLIDATLTIKLLNLKLKEFKLVLFTRR